MKQPRNNVFDAADSGFFAPAIKALQSDFRDWELAEARTRECLWGVLGSIYELAPKIEANQNAHLELVSLVSQVESVRTSNRWRAETKRPSELLLVLLLGLTQQTKSTRSQWRSAMKAADRAKIETTSRAFVEWISKIGGIEQARRTIASPRRRTQFRKLAAKADKFVVGEDREVQIPDTISGGPLPERFGLVLVREGSSAKSAFQLATITNEYMVRKALSDFLKHEEQIERDALADLRLIQSKRMKHVRQLFKEAGGEKGTYRTLEEFLYDWEDEQLLTAEERATRITETR